MVETNDIGVESDSTRSMSPSLPPRYSRRFDDEIVDHLAEQQSPRYSRLFDGMNLIPPSLIPPAIPEDGSSSDFSDMLRSPSSARSFPNLRRPNLISSRLAARARPLQPELPPGPLSLIIDSGAIYPPPPSTALYHLPRALTWNGNEIFVNLSIPAASPPNSSAGRRRPFKDSPRDLNLYVLRRTPFTNEIALMPKRSDGKSAIMKGKRNMFGGGMTWDVEVHGKVVLSYAKGKWKDSKGSIVAAERRRDAKSRAGENTTWLSSQKPEITIFKGGVAGLSEEMTRHLIVAAWSGRMWQSKHRQPPLIRALVRGRAYFNHGYDPP